MARLLSGAERKWRGASLGVGNREGENRGTDLSRDVREWGGGGGRKKEGNIVVVRGAMLPHYYGESSIVCSNAFFTQYIHKPKRCSAWLLFICQINVIRGVGAGRQYVDFFPYVYSPNQPTHRFVN